MVAQALAYHLRVPGIVLLLAVGVLLGPDGVGIIHPGSLGPALNILTGFAVAVILFEGGINLKFRRLKRAQRSIRQLIMVGGAVTAAGGAAAAHFIMDWPWKTALLFGTLVMVTGPTVINPLLKRLKVKRQVATVLEAEGVLIDALGAVVAVVALETALGPAHGSPLVWGWHVVSRLAFGALAGGAAGLLLIFLYRVRRLIPEGTANVFTLSIVLALFQGANAILSESGIAAVTMAGLVIGNLSSRALRDLVEFKEELTVLLIGMLFVLLAADVRLAQVLALGWPGLGVVLVLMFIVRPAAVAAGTVFSELGWRERWFIAWIGPRGIVAAAVASFFAAEFTARGIEGGYELRALVFLVIAVTVVFAGLTGGPMAGLLGLRRPRRKGWVILGANALARAVALLFKENGQEVVCIDANPDHCAAAENDCTRVLCGNGLEARSLLRAEIDTRRGALALTPNDEVNYLFVQKVKEETREVPLYVALKSDTASLTPRDAPRRRRRPPVRRHRGRGGLGPSHHLRPGPSPAMAPHRRERRRAAGRPAGRRLFRQRPRRCRRFFAARRISPWETASCSRKATNCSVSSWMPSVRRRPRFSRRPAGAASKPLKRSTSRPRSAIWRTPAGRPVGGRCPFNADRPPLF